MGPAFGGPIGLWIMRQWKSPLVPRGIIKNERIIFKVNTNFITLNIFIIFDSNLKIIINNHN